MSKYSELADRLDATREPIHAIVAWEAGSALRELEAERDRLRDALTFYADENAWSKGTVDEYLVDASIFDWPGDYGDEPWDIARAALEPKP